MARSDCLLAEAKLRGLDRVFGNALLNEGYAQRDVIWTWLDGQPPGDRLRSRGRNCDGCREKGRGCRRGTRRQHGPWQHAEHRSRFALHGVVFKEGKDQREAAVEWLATLPDKEARRAAFDQVASDWVVNDPAGALALVTGPHGDLAPSSMLSWVAGNEAAKNPEAAMEWASKLSADHVDRAREAVLLSWLSVRPEAAANYVRKLPADPERERAVNTATRGLAWQAPEQAAAWILTLLDADQTTAIKCVKGIKPEQCRKIEAAMKKAAK